MRLLKTDTFELLEFVGENISRYAILSHTWEGKEVSFHDIRDPEALWYLNAEEPPTPAWAKIKHACLQARKDSFEFIWIDTCCIDKSSSAELQEAINSMFAWYRKSAICYAFLSDIRTPRPEEVKKKERKYLVITESRWFTRGWTLQELLAPEYLHFYDANWKALGERNNWAHDISIATKIPINFLSGSDNQEREESQAYVDLALSSVIPSPRDWYGRISSATRTPATCLTGSGLCENEKCQLNDGHFARIKKKRKTGKSLEDKLRDATVAAKMPWAADRQTTRVEDQAYCLLGLFDINMPMLYGEGEKAFMRLQEEIMKKSDDATILAWGYGLPFDRDAYMHTIQDHDAPGMLKNFQSLREQAHHIQTRSPLATSPASFRFAGGLQRYSGSEDLSLDFGISQRGLMLDGWFALDPKNYCQYLFLPCTDAYDNVLAIPLLSLFDIYRSPSHRYITLATGFCLPIATALRGESISSYGPPSH